MSNVFSKLAAKKNQSPEDPPSPMTSVSEDILMHCIARVPRSYHPFTAFVSKQFLSLVTSPELYKVRSRIGFYENCLYVAISKSQSSNVYWYTLGRKPNNKLWLLPITSLPPMPLHASYVAIGPCIYVIGGFQDWGVITQSVSRIDCVSHTMQPLTEIPKGVAGSVSEHINGKIYVIGGSDTQSRELKSSSETIMVFDTKAQTWEVRTMNSQIWRPDWVEGQKLLSSVEMEGMIYMRSYGNSYEFEPKEGKYRTNRRLHSKEWSNASVIDNVLYYFDVRMSVLRAFDLKENIWEVVKGVDLGVLEDGSWSCTENYGENLAVFLQKMQTLTEKTKIWCAEIAVERRADGEIWGNVEWYEVVLNGNSWIMKCLAVKV